MRFLLIALGVLLAPVPAAALDYCEELWFTRNLLYHNAGHCFGSPLGKAVFGNAGCDASGVALSDSDLNYAARLQAAESLEGCAVNTKRTSLAIPNIEARKALIDLPFPSLFESSCIGWQGTPIALRNGVSAGAKTVGEIRPGDVVQFQYEDLGPWSFVEITKDGQTTGLGWAQITFGEDSCEMVAG